MLSIQTTSRITSQKITEPLPIKKFPNGELLCELPSEFLNYMKSRKSNNQVIILWDTIKREPDVSLQDELMMVALCVNALRNNVGMAIPHDELRIELQMNMLPYARQDRLTHEGSCIANKVFINMLNNLNFSTIRVNDIHSDSSRVLFADGTLHEKSQAQCFVETVQAFEKENGNSLTETDIVVFIAPDAGATKKTWDVSQAAIKDIINDKQVVLVVNAEKHRDVRTGKLSNSHINLCNALKQANVDVAQPDCPSITLFVVDDLCDGGATFIKLAQAIDNDLNNHASQANIQKCLYVTHGLFSKGIDVLKEHYTNVISHNNL